MNPPSLQQQTRHSVRAKIYTSFLPSDPLHSYLYEQDDDNRLLFEAASSLTFKFRKKIGTISPVVYILPISILDHIKEEIAT